MLSDNNFRNKSGQKSIDYIKYNFNWAKRSEAFENMIDTGIDILKKDIITEKSSSRVKLLNYVKKA